MAKLLDRTGLRYGRLTVLKQIGYRKIHPLWECQCDCGNITQVIGSNLGRTGSCGCLNREQAVAKLPLMLDRVITHGATRGGATTRAYSSWKAMLQRCQNPKSLHWRHYGGRGITVCERWQSFQTFLTDMGERPAGTELERKDNDRGYEPGNCLWGTRSDQTRNSRRNPRITICGERMPVIAACDKYGVPMRRIYYAVSYHRLTHTEAFLQALEGKYSASS